ncbi:hypothetical protein PGTUg99_011818 [Puccinia graminis f. sp. tritici]|uniref:Uncharacterized protein n=1 Tax=Puccinia graminis f. sp. tritici TaxID=56615 RepID=A0A5B0RVN5_PUCGR|nr:hypothetical protein PGTUg99_011818 [Puccinia graminis f. sp. tritici]
MMIEYRSRKVLLQIRAPVLIGGIGATTDNHQQGHIDESCNSSSSASSDYAIPSHPQSSTPWLHS